jgi:hypothetical protein
MKYLKHLALVGCAVALCGDPASAQSSGESWHWMADGAAFTTFNRQSSDRGDTQFRSQNWLMGMGTRKAGKGSLFVTAMITAEPGSVGKRGYSQLFQMGEAYNGLENVDRQHPHDLFSQLSLGFRVPIGGRSALTIVGAPVGEATLGPVAFMHRLSASENPTAPLAHHTLDSSHIVQGVLAGALDAGPVSFEASAFHGREPDENRFGITPGGLDSWATRVWFRPSSEWTAQVSYGALHQPEQLEPGDVKRTTGSVTWTRESTARALSVTAAVGHNKRTYTGLTAFLGEALGRIGRTSLYTRVEILNIETEHLLFPAVVHRPHPGELIDRLNAYTFGGVRNVSSAKWFSLGLGADVTFYDLPIRLVPHYSDKPFGVHVFGRIRPRGRLFMRMWNMTMTSPMRHSGVSMQ